MKSRPIILLHTFICSFLITSSCFSQSDFTAWIKEIEIDGQKVKILRVPEEAITMSRAKYDVVGAQKQLDKCYKEYKEGKQTYKSSIEFNIEFLKVNVPDWPISYYEEELKAYASYNKIQGKRDIETMLAKNKRIDDSIRLAKQVAGYYFINKPVVVIKEKPSPGSMTMATVYSGSYVNFMGALENTDYIVIHAGTGIGYTGYVHVDDVVDNLDKLKVSAEEMALLKSRYYCKIQESAAYEAKVEKIARAEMAAEAKAQSSGTKSRRTYITGPRGGCYYINSNGNKTYVDHSFCR